MVISPVLKDTRDKINPYVYCFVLDEISPSLRLNIYYPLSQPVNLFDFVSYMPSM